jgi:tripartite-type tricarboxylate transporter receptor subunit TctC
VREKLVEMGADVVASPPQDFANFMAAESAKWAKVIKEAHIQAE